MGLIGGQLNPMDSSIRESSKQKTFIYPQCVQYGQKHLVDYSASQG